MESTLTYNESRYRYIPKYFALSEFSCQETNQNEMKDEFLKKLDLLREACGFPFIITSGYRSTNHTIERDKPNGGGTHTQGIAADIRALSGAERYTLIKHALALGFTGVGVAKSFVHVDIRTTVPVMWTY